METYFLLFRIAPGWILPITKSPDLAIVELERHVEFEPSVISPICLPSGNVQDIPSEKVSFDDKYFCLYFFVLSEDNNSLYSLCLC